MRFAAMLKHQKQEQVFHGLNFSLHPCWELTLRRSIVSVIVDVKKK